MNSLKEISAALEKAQSELKLKDAALARDTGVQRLTVVRALSGRENFGVTTLLALADRLGLEVMLVPKDAARALRGPADTSSAPVATVADQIRGL